MADWKEALETVKVEHIEFKEELAKINKKSTDLKE